MDSTSATAGAGDEHQGARSRVDDVRERFAAVIGSPQLHPPVDSSPVDVRAYLLDPPPTPEQLARAQLRRARVRTWSIAGAGLLAVVLVAPMPGGSPEPEASSDAARPAVEAAAAAADAAEPDVQEARPDEPVLPQRVDRPPPASRKAPAKPARARSTRANRAAPVAAQPAPPPVRHAARAPASNPAAPSTPQEGVLVPVA